MYVLFVLALVFYTHTHYAYVQHPILHFIYLLSLYNECNRVRDPSLFIPTNMYIFTNIYNYINISLSYSLS